jgi:PTS system glucitol/sorbitol-specific IIA component
MTQIWKTEITAVGPEVADLAEGGVVIFFEHGAPPELAEVSVLHRQSDLSPTEEPTSGTPITIGPLAAHITAIGEKAWAKVREMGHVVINFNGASATDRPGEICATPLEGDHLAAALTIGATVTIGE